MKIGILTHPQHANYGGILQCYALSTYLKKMGHDPIVIKRMPNENLIKKWIISFLRKMHFSRYYKPNLIDRTRNIRPFVEKNLSHTHSIRSEYQMHKLCKKYDLKMVIVGSDQVWRKSFAMKYGYNFFLDFVPGDIIKISYAASFGVSEWQYSQLETEKIRSLIDRFSGISVREEEAVLLCKKNLDVDVECLIDPTLLLNMDDYEKLISPRLIDNKYIFVYWLGDIGIINSDINDFKNKGYEVVELNLKKEVEQMSVEDWLSHIKYADKIITDSFHGVVFSILFQKDFSIYRNESGGYGRLQSLINILGISNIINDPTFKLDYSVVYSKLELLRSKSDNFLRRTIK